MGGGWGRCRLRRGQGGGGAERGDLMGELISDNS